MARMSLRSCAIPTTIHDTLMIILLAATSSMEDIVYGRCLGDKPKTMPEDEASAGDIERMSEIERTPSIVQSVDQRGFLASTPLRVVLCDVRKLRDVIKRMLRGQTILPVISIVSAGNVHVNNEGVVWICCHHGLRVSPSTQDCAYHLESSL